MSESSNSASKENSQDVNSSSGRSSRHSRRGDTPGSAENQPPLTIKVDFSGGDSKDYEGNDFVKEDLSPSSQDEHSKPPPKDLTATFQPKEVTESLKAIPTLEKKSEILPVKEGTLFEERKSLDDSKRTETDD